MHENNTFVVFFLYIYIYIYIYIATFWRKPGILILNLYLYSIKIQTNIN
jgi:hypothetical protein